MRFIIVLLLACIFPPSAFADAPKRLKGVDYVDLKSYQGTWYEIARLPQVFEAGCSCVKAEYALRKDGTMSVRNSCELKGQTKEVKGIAKVTNFKTNSELLVQFPNNPAGRYVILHVDSRYRFAVVGSDSKDAGGMWILSRSRTLDPESMETALAVASSQFDLSDLIMTDQLNCD